MNKNEVGALFLVAGTAIGAGMLALPIATAKFGFLLTLAIMFVTTAIMGYLGKQIAKLCILYSHHDSMGAIVGEILGRPGHIVMNIAWVGLFYAILSAYTAGGSSILIKTLRLSLPDYIMQAIYILVLATPILISKKVVDLSNRTLLIVKLGLFITLLVSLTSRISLENYERIESSGLFSLLPLLMTAFAYHIIIPAIVKFVGKDSKNFGKIFYGGSLICFVVYSIWISVALGVLPYEGSISFKEIIANGSDIGDFVHTLGSISGNTHISAVVQGFSLIAIITSFLGVGMGFMDYWESLASKTSCKRLVQAIFTFVPPYICAVFYPQGFVSALGLAAIALSLISAIIPAICMIKIRTNNLYQYYLALAFGSLVVIIEIINKLGL